MLFLLSPCVERILPQTCVICNRFLGYALGLHIDLMHIHENMTWKARDVPCGNTGLPDQRDHQGELAVFVRRAAEEEVAAGVEDGRGVYDVAGAGKQRSARLLTQPRA